MYNAKILVSHAVLQHELAVRKKNNCKNGKSFLNLTTWPWILILKVTFEYSNVPEFCIQIHTYRNRFTKPTKLIL